MRRRPRLGSARLDECATGRLHGGAFDLSETVVCPTCAASMQAPCVAPAIRCAGCREVIYPSPPSSPELSVTLADNSPTDNAAGNESVRAQPTGQQLAIAIGRLARPAGAGLPPAEPG